MPNIKSAKKRVLVAAARNAKNKADKSELRTSIKNFDAAVQAADKSAAAEAYTVAVKKIDRAATNNLIHKNNASRKKSSLTLKLNAMAD